MSINENGKMQGKDGRLDAQNGDLSNYDSLDTAIHRVNIHMKPTGMPTGYTFFQHNVGIDSKNICNCLINCIRFSVC